MTNEEIQSLIKETKDAVDAGVTPVVTSGESMIKEKLNKAQNALQPHLDRMTDKQRERVENAMQALRVFKPAYYNSEVYEYQCVLPLTETLLSIGEELERQKKD